MIARASVEDHPGPGNARSVPDPGVEHAGQEVLYYYANDFAISIRKPY